MRIVGRRSRWLLIGCIALVLLSCGIRLVVIEWQRQSDIAQFERAAYYDADERRRTLDKAAVVIEKLNDWKRAHGTYPSGLEDALGTYGSDLAPNAGYSKWYYFSADGGARFALVFGIGDSPYPNMMFSSDSAAWTEDS